MSWERRWRFEKLPTEIELRRHVEAVRETAGLEVACFAVRDDGDVAIQFDVPVAGAERIPAKLGVSDDAPEAILRDLDPPWPQGEDDVIPSHYTLNVDVHPQEEDDGDDEQDKRPCVSVYSNVNDNLRATPVLVALAEALAVRLGNREGHEQETAKDAVMPIPTDLSIPDALPLLYTRSFVAFPGVTFVLDIGRPSTIAASRWTRRDATISTTWAVWPRCSSSCECTRTEAARSSLWARPGRDWARSRGPETAIS